MSALMGVTRIYLLWAISLHAVTGLALQPDGPEVLKTIIDHWEALPKPDEVHRWQIIHEEPSLDGAVEKTARFAYTKIKSGHVCIAGLDEQNLDAAGRYWIFNPQYQADITRPQSGGRFLLNSVERTGDDIETQRAESRLRHHRRHPWEAVYGTLYWKKLFGLPGFKLQKVESHKWEDKEAITIHYRFERTPGYLPPANPWTGIEPAESWHTASITVLPQHHWVPVHWKIQGVHDKKWELETTAVYDFSDPRNPRMVERTDTAFNTPTDAPAKTVTRFEELPPHRARDSEFRLTHFGLPEPDWYRPPPPYWLYLGIAAVVLVMLGLVIMHFANKRR